MKIRNFTHLHFLCTVGNCHSNRRCFNNRDSYVIKMKSIMEGLWPVQLSEAAMLSEQFWVLTSRMCLLSHTIETVLVKIECN